ncbi:MAG: hypothetical protein IJ775_01740 [Muribaculaceae bacterium]|nr:hypothetical protein [Muribaculaceae bacterium]
MLFNIITGINQVEVPSIATTKRYMNAMGQVSDHPWNGINFEITTYNNGNVTTTKFIK